MRPVLILLLVAGALAACDNPVANQAAVEDRKSTRLNSSH